MQRRWGGPTAAWVVVAVVVASLSISAETAGNAAPAVSPMVSSASVPVSPSSSLIQYVGRWDRSNPASYSAGWPGTGLVASFSGTSIAGTFGDDNGNNRLNVSIDGRAPNVVRLVRGTATFTLASGLSPSGTHTISVSKRTEGCCGAGSMTFAGFLLDAGASLVAPPQVVGARLRIEFFGDSAGAGYSADSYASTSDTSVKNADHAHPAIAASLLGADYHNESWSGIGLVKGYGNSLPLSQVWLQTVQGKATPQWDTSSWTPDVVVLNVGSNDVLNGVSKSQLSAGTVSFVALLRAAYPSAHIVIASEYGWSSVEEDPYIGEILATIVANGDSNVSVVRLPWLFGKQELVYCEQASFGTIIARHIATVLGLSPPTASPASCLPPAGAVVNGGLEQATLPLQPVADGWRPFNTAGGSATLVTGTGHGSGSHYVQLSAKTGYAGISQATDASAGTAFAATGWLRSLTVGKGATGRLRLEFRDEGQNLLSQTVTLGSLPSSGAWTQLTVTGVAPLGTWQVRVVCVSDTGFVIGCDDLALSHN